MRIAVIGVGNVGGNLARLWTEAGHDVKTAKRSGGPTPAAVAAVADVIALCVPGTAVIEAATSLGDVAGKVLIDCTNPLAPDLSGLLYGGTTSAAERLQAAIPTAKVVKAFNSLGAGLLGIGEKADGFYCGDDAGAKRTVEQLVHDARLRPVDVGLLRNARYLEAMAMLWIDLVVNQQRGGSFTFNLVNHA
jgi:8-hydroxy-5-deazaflavin:NADPH oxidoreductase